MRAFLDKDFLLNTEAAKKLYHEAAEQQPIIDYHCHLNPKEIWEDIRYENITQVWLGGDHYKWRALRAAGVPEKYITGDASDWEKFERWAEICPLTVRNPLFHWTALELNRPFGINDRFLNKSTAKDIWEECNAKLATPEFSARGIMKQMNVELVCTTDDPADSLEHHKKLAADYASGNFSVRVLPTFRPDKVFPRSCATPEGVVDYLSYLLKLSEASDVDISSFASLRVAFAKRHAYFHSVGARLSDCGFELFQWEAPSAEVLPSRIFDGMGKDGSRGIKVESAAGASQDWDSQFWIYLPTTLPAGTKYKVEFDYRADRDASADTQAHAAPGNYIFYSMIGSPAFTTEWQHYEKIGSITADQASNADGLQFQSIAFNLSKDRENDVKFFFDNIKFMVEKSWYDTGIRTISNDAAGKNIFNLRGQQVQNPSKGLYIINGKKVVVK